MFSDLIETAVYQERGVSCYVSFEFNDRSPGLRNYLEAQLAVATQTGVLSLLLAPIFLTTALPYYAGDGGTAVVYLLFRDGQLTQTYRYPITKKGAGWVVLLPFAWLNFFTNDLKDAVRGTTLQFLIDAQRDGNL
jgi:hypothetical protein